jgi:hypothetical protein
MVASTKCLETINHIRIPIPKRKKNWFYGGVEIMALPELVELSDCGVCYLVRFIRRRTTVQVIQRSLMASKLLPKWRVEGLGKLMILEVKKVLLNFRVNHLSCLHQN